MRNLAICRSKVRGIFSPIARIRKSGLVSLRLLSIQKEKNADYAGNITGRIANSIT